MSSPRRSQSLELVLEERTRTVEDDTENLENTNEN